MKSKNMKTVGKSHGLKKSKQTLTQVWTWRQCCSRCRVTARRESRHSGGVNQVVSAAILMLSPALLDSAGADFSSMNELGVHPAPLCGVQIHCQNTAHLQTFGNHFLVFFCLFIAMVSNSGSQAKFSPACNYIWPTWQYKITPTVFFRRFFQ